MVPDLVPRSWWPTRWRSTPWRSTWRGQWVLHWAVCWLRRRRRVGLSHQQPLLSGGDRRRGPAPLVRARRAREVLGGIGHRARGPLRQVHATLPSPPGGGGDVRLTSGVVQSLLATLTAESLDAGAFAYGALLGAMGAGLCWAPSLRCRRRAAGRASCRGGGRHLRIGRHRRGPLPGSGWRGRPLHRRDRLGVDLGDSQRHRPVARPGVGQRPGGLPLHLGLRRRPPAGSSTGRLDRVGLRNPSRLCGAGDRNSGARIGYPNAPPPPPGVGSDPAHQRTG